MSPAGLEIVESIRKIQSERDALLDLLRAIDSRVGVILPDDLAAAIHSRLN